MTKAEYNIGTNIREVRNGKRLSQEKLASKCGFSNTTLSQYENHKKTPNVTTLAKIAKALGVSIDRLYYGDEDNSFITAEPDVGRRIVNAIYMLWSEHIIETTEELWVAPSFSQGNEVGGSLLFVRRFSPQIFRLIDALDDFENTKGTYPDPDIYIEQILASVANEINAEIESHKGGFRTADGEKAERPKVGI